MEDKERSICIDCGLCCDGTMFHAMDTFPSDDLTPLQARGALLVTDAQSRRFLQPCPAFDGSCCSVYVTRPTSCRTYVCSLLESVTNGEASIAGARSAIERVKELSGIVRNCLDTAPESNVVHLGRYGLSTYLGVMENAYEHDQLDAAFPEAAELISLLKGVFGWTNRVVSDHQIVSDM